MFITGSHEIGTSDRRAGKGLLFKIKVGEGCWLGARTMIVGNINIGAASIVAAGSVVTKEVGRNHLVAGDTSETSKKFRIALSVITRSKTWLRQYLPIINESQKIH